MKIGDLAYIRVKFPGQNTLGHVAMIVAQPNDGFWIVRLLGENREFECAPEYLLPIVGGFTQQNEDAARAHVAQNSAEE